MATLLILVAASGLMLTGAGLAMARRARQQHAESMRLAASRLGWGYREEVPLDVVPDLGRFELFGRGTSRQLRHLMTSPADETRAVVFEYSYTVSSGKSTQTYRQTVFYATSDGLALPSFSLRPENFFHRVAAAFGYQDIDLEGHPEFSRLFLLRGDDEAAVRVAFNDRVAAFFERRPGMCAAGCGRELLYWRPGRRVAPEALREFIGEGYELAEHAAGVPRGL
jgi:hypothetical protein